MDFRLPHRGAEEADDDFVDQRRLDQEEVRQAAAEAAQVYRRQQELDRARQVEDILQGGLEAREAPIMGSARMLTDAEWREFPELPQVASHALVFGTMPVSAERAMAVSKGAVAAAWHVLLGRVARFKDKKSQDWLMAFSGLVMRDRRASTARRVQRDVVARCLEVVSGSLSEETLSYLEGLAEFNEPKPPLTSVEGASGEEARSSKATAQLRERDLRNATRTMTSTGSRLITTRTDEVEAAIKKKLPAAPEGHPDVEEQQNFKDQAGRFMEAERAAHGAQWGIRISIKDVDQALDLARGFRTGTAAGDGGLAQALLRRLMSMSNGCREHLVVIAQALVDGELAMDSIMATTLKGFAIDQGGKARVGGMACSTLRLVKRVVSIALERALGHVFPQNFCGKNAGTVRATGLIRSELEDALATGPVAYIAQADVENQHMGWDREKAIGYLAADDELKCLVAMATATLLGPAVRLRFDWQGEEPSFRPCETGTPIGDPTASIMAKLTHAAAMRQYMRTMDHVPKGVYYADDVACVLKGVQTAQGGSLDLTSVMEFVGTEEAILSLIGLKLGARKHQLHVQGDVEDSVKEATELEYLEVFPEGHVSFGDTVAGGMEHLGAPVSRSRAYEEEHAASKLLKLLEAMERVVTHTSAPKQVRLAILRNIISTRGTYLLQGVTPDAVEDLTEEVDTATARLFAQIVGCAVPVGAQLVQLHLPQRSGGLGFANLTRRIFPLFLSARAWTLQDRTFGIYTNDASRSRVVADTLPFLNRFNLRMSVAHRFRDLAHVVSVVMAMDSQGKRGGASALQKHVDEPAHSSWWRGLSPRDKVLASSLAETGLVDVLVCPVFTESLFGPHVVLSGDQATVAIMSHMVEADFTELIGAPLHPDARCGRRPRAAGGAPCAEPIDSSLCHVLNCQRGSTARHNKVLGVVELIARQSGHSISKNVAFTTPSVATAHRPSRALFADTVIEGLAPVSTFVDLTIRSSITQLDLAQATRIWAASNKPGGAKKLLLRVVERAVKEKLKIYKAAAQADGVNFLPFVISSYGIMNPGATATLKNLSEHWALYNEDTASIRYRQSVRMLQVSVVQQFAQSRLNLIQDQRRVRHLDARAREGL